MATMTILDCKCGWQGTDAELDAGSRCPWCSAFIAIPAPADANLPQDPEEGYWRRMQERARAAPLMPRYWGLTRTAAITHLRDGILKQRYDDHQEALEGISAFTNHREKIFSVAFGVFGLILGLVLQLAEGDSALDANAIPAWAYAMMGLLFGGSTGITTGYASKWLRWYNVAYGEAVGLEHQDEVEPWRVTAVGETKLPRLSFIAEKEDYYFGSTKEAGVNKGIMLFSVPPEAGPMRDMRLRKVFEMPVGEGKLTGITGRATRALLDSSEELAEEKRNMGASFKKHISETALYIFLGVLMILVFLQLSSGNQLVPVGNTEEAAGATARVEVDSGFRRNDGPTVSWETR